MKTKFLLYSILAIVFIFSCEDDDENLNGTGIVNFTLDELVEIENATIPLNINLGVDTFNHGGGTVDVSISGANYGTDYETSGGSANFSIEIGQGSLSSSFSLTPIDNDTIDGNLNLTITITNATGALTLGENTTLQFTILDDDDPLIAIVGFENATGTLQENDATNYLINIPFNQASTDGGTITITASGDAVFGTDYTVVNQTASPFTVTVPAGATSASFEMTAIDNTVFAANKTATFTITEVTGGLATGVTTATTITIENDDSPPNPVIDFDAANTLTYNEDAGTITLNFNLSGATTADATIELTASGTADTSDFNFGGSNSPYSFVIPAGSTTASLDITIVDDIDTETDETIVLDITSVSGGLDTGVNLQQQTLTITDNDTVAAFNYVETFETVADLEAAGFNAFLLSAQDLPSSKKFKYNMNAGKYADVDDVTQDSDTGLVVFYNTTQNGNGVLDNVVITPQMQVTGNVDVSIDIAYSQAPAVNNAVVTFYYSEVYDGTETWNQADWTEIGTETAADMNTEGIAIGDYKRKVMNITPNANFYIAVRVNQTIDNTFTKTQWRLDNFKVNN
ncbi:hypothetical protein [Pontimicrobium sp. MEBiC06410]